MPKTNYRNKGRTCCKCGNNKTYTGSDNREQWFRYKIDEEGNYNKYGYWDMVSHLCDKCYRKTDGNHYSLHHDKMKSVTLVRTGTVPIDKEQGKSLLDQAVVTRVLGIDDLNIKMDNFLYHTDAKNEKYGAIEIKGSHLYMIENIWRFDTRGNIVCDTYVLLGYNHDRSNIDFVWIVPNENWKYEIKIHNTIRMSKFDEFKVDPNSYNDTYHSLMRYLKDKRYFGIEDIKRWSETMKQLTVEDEVNM